MRMAMGLDRPTSGSITIAGRPFAEHPSPLRSAGAVLDAGATHPGRTGRGHLKVLAATHGISMHRVDEVLGMTGLDSVAQARIKSYSLGMNQRLGIAAALLGDPEVLIFDEPVNGLDPEGVRWVRGLCKQLAGQGRTVFVSSHVMSEMAQTADHLIVLGRGSVIADAPLEDLLDTQVSRVRVRSERATDLMNSLISADVTLTSTTSDTFEAQGVDAATIGRCAAEQGIALSELTTLRASLEDYFLALTGEHMEYRSSPIVSEAEQQS